VSNPTKALPLRVLIVDDSAFDRSVIGKKLSAHPDINVVGYAKDGLEAVAQVQALKPDVVTMDVSMPNLDGLGALERIMRDFPTPVVMLSALTGEQSQTTIAALELGAVDFYLKPSIASPTGAPGADLELVEKLKAAASVPAARLRSMAAWNRSHRLGAAPTLRTVERAGRFRAVVVIGTSTGGPRALAELIPALPRDLPAALLVVQHMPPMFTRSLAERLNHESQLEVKEAEEGDHLSPGRLLLAPGGYHMVVGKGGSVSLNQESPECAVRPAVNVTMASAARYYGRAVLGVVLTGMGSDGTRGSAAIKAAGGRVIVEAESTCAVYGMPKSVKDAGHADNVLPLNRMAEEIIRICGETQKAAAGVRP
jgi:two-component system chemotaxis response regulator CheB